MASNGEDDDTEDLEALRKAALATLKPKVQPIEQVISTGISRHQTPEWSEVPASVDYPVFADPVPEPSPFPVPHHGIVAQPPLRQPSQTAWGGHHFMNGIPDNRFKFQGFPGDRRPFLFHPRPSHRSFGDRGRPLHDRGRRPRRGYVTSRGGFSLTNVNSSIPTSHMPRPNVPLSSVAEPVPAGGNLIVIQPHKSTDTSDNLSQDSKGPASQPVVNTSKSCTLTSTAAPETTSAPSPQKPKLVLPQDRYHSSQTSSREEIKKSEPEQPVKKPKDKFSRYDKSDSEDEDDWMDNHSEVDDIAQEIDKFLQDVDQDEDNLEKDVNVEDSKVEDPMPEEPQASEEISDLISEEEVQERGSHRSSPLTSEAESLDLDALANGDPVIGDFDDLDFLVDKEPVSESVNDSVRLMASDGDHSAIPDGAQLIKRTVDKYRETTPVSSSSSPPSSVPRSPKENQDIERKGLENDGSNSKDIDTNTSPKRHSKGSLDELSHTRSLSPISNKSSPRERGRRLKGSRSPCPQSRSLYRSRSPIPLGTTYPKRFSPRRSSVSPRRSPLQNRESPFRRRSPRRRSLSPYKRMPRRSSSPKRISSPLRQNASPQRKSLYRRRSISPRGRRRSPYGRSNSPHGRDGYRNDSRNRKNFETSRRGGENLRYGGRSSQGSLSPSSRPQERGRWPEAIGKNRWSPNRSDRKAQQTQLRDTSLTGSIGNNYNGREDPSKGLFMDDKELEKLSPEERAKIEARRKKFASKEEVKLEDAKKTVSLKSIKERKKKMKKNEKRKDDPVDVGLSEPLSKKDKSGISLKALRKKMELKKTNQEDSSEEDEVPSPSLNDLEDDSDNSDTGRAWRQEVTNVKSLRSIKPHSTAINHRLDHRERSRPKSHKAKDYRRARRSPVTKAKSSRFPSDFQKNEMMSDEEDYNENIPSSHLGSSVVASSQFKLDVPPEKLRIQIQVSPKDKKMKKSKTKPDFSNVYSVPAKRGLGNKDDDEEEEDEENEEKAVPKKKAKKKEKKVKKKKSEKEDPEENLIAAVSAEPVPKPRPSILERLGKKVGLDVVEKKKKKKKSKQSHMDNAGERDDLDQHIEKMKLKNAAIERRQREIQLDKERYG